MALVPCRECKQDVSSKAKVCPHCGIPKPYFGLFGIFEGLLIMIIKWVLFSMMTMILFFILKDHPALQNLLQWFEETAFLLQQFSPPQTR